jgi:cytochrome P450
VTQAKEAFPLYGEDFKADPQTTYAALGEEGPLHRVEFPSGVVGWVVTDYTAGCGLLNDPEMSKDHRHGTDKWRATASRMPEPFHSRMQVHLMHRDPPDHTRMRRMLTEALSPRAVAAAMPRIREVAEELADRIEAVEETDLQATFAFPLAFIVLCELVGIPRPAAERFERRWCEAVNSVGPRHPHRAHYVQILRELDAFITDLLTQARQSEDENLLRRLVENTDRGELTPEELSSTVFQLLIPGSGPVMTQIGNSALRLLEHPQALAQCRAHPEVLATAVDELLRFDGSFELTTWRLNTRPRELFGTEVPAGDPIMVSLASANRDPQRFPDPDRLDLNRAPNPHLSFGHGIHYCPGAALARAEVRVALEVLLRRFPNLSLAVPPDELSWSQAVLVHGLTALPVRPHGPD